MNLKTVELDQIAKRLNDREDVIDQITARWGNVGCELLNEVALQGDELKRAREKCGSRKFSGWIAAHFRKGKATAYRYIAVAEKLPSVSRERQIGMSIRALLAWDEEKESAPTSVSGPRINLPAFEKVSSVWDQLDEEKRAKLKQWLDEQLPKFIELKQQMDNTVDVAE